MSTERVRFAVVELESAGLVQIHLTGPTGMEVAFTLDPAEAQDLGERLVNAAVDVVAA